MGLIKSVAKFTAGGVTGAAAGAVAGLLLAPDSGPAFQRRLRERFRAAKVAGAEAQAAKETELIRKFRLSVNDAAALNDVEAQAARGRTEALAAPALNGR